MEETRALLRHLLATIAHRTRKCLALELAGFVPGGGVRTPAEIVRHMAGLCGGAGALLLGRPRAELPPLPWAGEIARLEAVLCELDAAVAAAPVWSGDPLRVVQGPLADMLTHAGQLAMLSRLAGAPLPAENFSQAPIQAGELRLTAG
jgi:hypothetical protein